MSGCPVLMLSSAGHSMDAARSSDLGIVRCLTKPVKESDLLDAILRALNASAIVNTPRTPTTRLAKYDNIVPLKILLTEDGLVNQKVAIGLLSLRGHKVQVANNGHEALELAQRHRFDVILMDVQMPEMDGFEATAAIRANERLCGGHVPIIAMTAHAMKGDRERCLDAGMDGYISKPVDAAELYSSIERYTPGRAMASGDAPSQSPRAQPLVLDWPAALQQMQGQTDLLQEVAQEFLRECPALLAEIREAFVKQDSVRARRAAHTLQGSAGIFAAHSTSNAARKLEGLAELGALGEAEAAFDDLRSEAELLLRCLQERLMSTSQSN